MRNKGINTQTELIELIEKHFGFKKERIKNPTQHGLWYVQFEVNGIQYISNQQTIGMTSWIK